MKKIILLSAILMVLLASSSVLFAQTSVSGDTLIIGPLNSDGQPLGALNEAISADTTATGERLHKVYKLQRNAQYILTEVIQGDFPLVIVADAPDDENRPPIVRCGVKQDGSSVNRWWILYDDATFKNIWVSGINLDGTGPIDWISQEVNSTHKTITYDGCIIEFPYTWWSMFADWGTNNVYKDINCIFMNIGNPTGAIWNGAIYNGGTIDSLIEKNCTFYNFGCFATNGTTFYVELDQNTFVNSVVHPVESHSDVIKVYTNNIFVNCHAFSDDKDEVKRHFDTEVKGLMNYAEIQFDPQQLDSLYGPGGAYGKNYDPNGDGTLTEGELAWTLRNNNWYYTQPIKDYWAQFPQVIPNPWMNNYNKAMFASATETSDWTWDLKKYTWADSNGNIITDPTNYDTLMIVDSTVAPQVHEPFIYFSEENTTNMDPGLVNINGTDALLAQNCINMRDDSYGLPAGDPVKFHGIDNYLAFTWPVTFDLGFTEASLLTGSDDGLPIGDLFHWFPASYDQWVIIHGTAVEDNNTSAPADFVLYSNYPNPFNPTTTIKYDINTMGNVKLTVHNVLGEQVKTLVNQVKSNGSYQVQWDGTNDLNQKVASGVYFYRLEQGNNIQINKMMLVK